MEIKIEGLDELIDDFKELEHRVKELEGVRSIPLKDLFTTTFVKENTSFDDPDKFFDLLPDPDEADIKELDNFASTFSKFDTWEELLRTSTLDHAEHHLFEGLFD